jgi:ABC-2 family transporter protein
MTPYLAVLKDCFREALASRILWLLTGLITLVLFVGLAPFTLLEESAARFQRNEFRNAPEFLKYLASLEKSQAPSAARQIWSRLPDSLRHRLRDSGTENVNEQVEVLFAVRGELNGMLNSQNLYDPALWSPRMLSNEAQRLQERGPANLSEEERQRLNRLLIDAAFPDYILPAPSKVLYAAWFGYRLGTPLPFEPKQLTLLVNFALAALTTFLAGILGVFIAILVTASTVPQTFEPGAIDLLLSKPVSRSLLFLTKFFGASTFILLNSAYLIGGMWLIAGLRFDIWSGRLLLCIPVFLFLFVIYYSVSALTGVIWRNAIVSVCCTILFWGLCFAVGTAKSVAENTFLDPTRLAAVLPAGDKLLAVNKSGQTFEWSAAHKMWEEIFRGRDGGPNFFFRERMLGPIYDPKGDRLVAIESKPTRFEFFGAAGKLLLGPRKDDWRRIDSAGTPSGPQALFIDPKGQIIIVSLTGIFRFEGTGTHEHHPFNVLGIDLAPHDGSDRFVRMNVSPDQKWQQPFTAAMNRADGSLAIYSRGKLIVLVPKGANRYAIRGEAELETDKRAVLAFAGSRIVVAQADGRVRAFAAPGAASGSILTELPALKSKGDAKPRTAAASPDGHTVAVLFDDNRLWLYDLKEGGPISGRIGGQGEISAVSFSPEGELFVANGFGRVTTYQIDSLQRQQVYAPPAETLEILYHYVVMPLYTVFPKPGELDGLVTYLVVGDPVNLFEQSRLPRDQQVNLPSRGPIDIWQPIWSNLVFLAVMLTITCVYITRRDF